MSAKVIPGLEQNDLDALVAYLDNELGPPTPTRPDGFGVTVKEYATEKGCTVDSSRKRLDAAVEKGLLKVERMICGTGTSPNVYYKQQE